MKIYGLIGYPLGHSFSERYFTDKFAREGIVGCRYETLPIENIAMLPQLLHDKPELCGLNVTIPYKQQVIPYLTAIDPAAQSIGAVNCIRIDDGQFTGYNTDEYGFRRSLLNFIGSERPSALILGTGGASKAVAYALGDLQIGYLNVSRTKTPDTVIYDELTPEIMASHRLIVNTTPLGTYPATEQCPPIPYHLLTATHYLYDLVYNPPLTRFLALGAERGAATLNGGQMLIDQAEKSWEIWNR